MISNGRSFDIGVMRVTIRRSRSAINSTSYGEALSYLSVLRRKTMTLRRPQDSSQWSVIVIFISFLIPNPTFCPSIAITLRYQLVE